MKKQPKNLLSKLLNAKQSNAMEQGIRMISVYDMVPNPENHYGIREVEKLAAQIRSTCNVEQLTVKPLEDGKYMIISGHRRREAVLLLMNEGFTGITPELSCRVVSFQAIGEKTAEEVEKQYLITANKGQRSYSTIEEQLWEVDTLRPIVRKDYEAELKAGTVTGPFRKYFSAYLGTSSSALQRLDSLRNLTPEILHYIDEGNITATAAAELAGLEHDKQTEIVDAIKASGMELTVKAIKEYKQKDVKPEEPEKPEEPIAEVPITETTPDNPTPALPESTTEATPPVEMPEVSPVEEHEESNIPETESNESATITEDSKPEEPLAPIPEENGEPVEAVPATESDSSSIEEDMQETPMSDDDIENTRRNAKEWVLNKLQTNILLAEGQLSSEHIENHIYWQSCIDYLEQAKEALLSA